MERFRSTFNTLVFALCSFCILVFWVVQSAKATQRTRESGLVFSRLNDPNTSAEATQEIIADEDPSARKYVSERLPDMIDTLPENLVWRNSVKLAGQLKAANAVVALARVLPHSESDVGIQSFSFAWIISRDPVGKALCEIGDPAVSAMAELLNHGDMSARWRALRVLWNLNSPAARKVMEAYLHNGDDSKIQSAIETLTKTKPLR